MRGIWKPGSNLIYRLICVLAIWTPLYRSKCENTTNASSNAESTSVITTLTTDISSTYQSLPASTSTSISNTAITSNRMASSPNTSYVSTSYDNTSTSVTIASTSTETNVSSTEITVTSITTSAATNSTVNVTNMTATIITSPAATTNATISNTSFVNCEVWNTTLKNNTKDRDECQPIKVNKTDIIAEEWTNVTIQSNFTIPHCNKVIWIRHYNRTTHGNYFPIQYRRPFIRSALYSLEICGQTYTHSLLHLYDLCISCDNGTLHLYGVNTTHSGRYTARCHTYEYHSNHGKHEDKNFNLIINPRNNTNYTNDIWICPQPTKDETQADNQSKEKHLTTTDNSPSHKPNHYSRTSHRSAWTVTLLCIACILLFFFRRFFNKKYRTLDDTVSESEFIVRYNPEHED